MNILNLQQLTNMLTQNINNKHADWIISDEVKDFFKKCNVPYRRDMVYKLSEIIRNKAEDDDLNSCLAYFFHEVPVNVVILFHRNIGELRIGGRFYGKIYEYILYYSEDLSNVIPFVKSNVVPFASKPKSKKKNKRKRNR